MVIVSMEDMKMLAATAVSKAVHYGQKDLSGNDFFLHPQAVAELVKGEGPTYYIVAILHDVLEDQPDKISADCIRDLFGVEIAEAVIAITRNKDEKYFDYIERCNQNAVARRVKIADIEHNSLPERFVEASKYERLLKRYRKALGTLRGHERKGILEDADHA